MEIAKEFQKNIYFYSIDYAESFVWIIANCGKFLKRGISNHPYLSLEKPVCGSRSNS